jgi:hypothetical protein
MTSASRVRQGGNVLEHSSSVPEVILVAEFDRDCGSVRNENCQDLLENIDAGAGGNMVELDCAGFSFVPSGSQLWPFCKKKGSKFY